MIGIAPISVFGVANGVYEHYAISVFKVTPNDAEASFFLDTRLRFQLIASPIDLNVCKTCGDVIVVLLQITDSNNGFSANVTISLNLLPASTFQIDTNKPTFPT